MAKRTKTRMTSRRDRVDENVGQLGTGGGGSNDATSGGGNAAGIPDADTALSAGDAVLRGDVKKDRRRIFGAAKPHRASGKNKRPD